MNNPVSLPSAKAITAIAGNVVYLIGGNWLNFAVRFVYAIVLAYFLGPEKYGILNYGIAWYLAFMPLTGLGLGIILSREVGRDRTRGREVVSQTFALRLLAGVIAAAACSVGGWQIETESELKILLLLFSLALLGRSLYTWVQSVFVAHEKMRYPFQLQAVCRPLEVVLGIVVLLAGGGILCLAIVQVFSWWLQALWGIFLFRRFNVKINLNFARSGLLPIFFQGLPIMICAILLTWLYQGPVVMFRHLDGGMDSLGQLALTMQIFMVFVLLPIAVNTVIMPVLSRAAERMDGKDVFYMSFTIRITMVLGAALAIGALGIGPWLVETVFGTRFAMAGHLVGAVMWLVIPGTCAGAILRVLYARGHFLPPVAAAGIGAAALTGTMPFFVTTHGALGAIIAAGIGMGVCAISMFFLFAMTNTFDWRKMVLKPGILVLTSSIVYWLLKPAGVWLSLPVSWCILLSGALLLRVITPEERKLIAGLLNTRGKTT